MKALRTVQRRKAKSERIHRKVPPGMKEARAYAAGWMHALAWVLRSGRKATTKRGAR